VEGALPATAPPVITGIEEMGQLPPDQLTLFVLSEQKWL
jgi:hypothetical protein